MAARLPYLDREQVPLDVQAVYDTMKKATRSVPNWRFEAEEIPCLG